MQKSLARNDHLRTNTRDRHMPLQINTKSVIYKLYILLENLRFDKVLIILHFGK